MNIRMFCREFTLLLQTKCFSHLQIAVNTPTLYNPESKETMKSDISLQLINVNNCAEVARIHISSFPESSLTKLGIETVRRYYVSQMDGTNDCLAIGAFQNNSMVGFIFAGIFHGVLTGFLINNRWFLVSKVLTHPWLVINPMFRDAIKLALKKLKNKKRQSVTSNIKRREFVVLSIAVDPGVQQKGIGQLLMDYVENEAIERGFKKMVLTVNPLNIKAIQFYEKNKWTKTSNYTGKNIEMTKQF